MRTALLTTLNMIQQVNILSEIKVSRNSADFLHDRIVIAVSEPTLLKFMEKLTALLDSSIGYDQSVKLDFFKVAGRDKAPAILNWLREVPSLTTSLVFLKKEEMEEAVEEIEVDEVSISDLGQAVKRRPFDIGIRVTCTTPLAHGGDQKAGNSKLFRRMDIMSDTGSKLTLPFYSGNAIRGHIRDLLADQFIRNLGMVPRRDEPPLALPFWYILYGGGSLEKADAKGIKKLVKVSGGTGIKAEGMRRIRQEVPHLSALGFSFGNRMIERRFDCGDLRPLCKQWNNGDQDVSELFEWTFLTRREDYENHEKGKNSSMIANTECLKAGVKLEGGINLSNHANEVEKAAVAMGLLLLEEHGRLGAESRRDLGGVAFEFENLPDPKPYDDFMVENKDKILEFLKEIDAFNEDEKKLSDKKKVVKDEFKKPEDGALDLL